MNLCGILYLFTQVTFLKHEVKVHLFLVFYEFISRWPIDDYTKDGRPGEV